MTSAGAQGTQVPGILGLAPIPGPSNFLDQMVKQKLLTKRLFTLKMTPNLKNSELTFGYIDSSFIRKPDEKHHFIGDSQGIVWQRMHEETKWKLPMGTFAVGPRS